MWNEMFDKYKKDLNEFVETVKHDTSEALSTLRDEFSADLNTFNLFSKNNDKRSSKKKTFREELEQNPSLLEEDGNFDNPVFESFSKSFNLTERNEEISALLSEENVVNEIFLKLVPEKLKHREFWLRFFFLRSQFRLKQTQDNDENENLEEMDGWDNEIEEESPEDKSDLKKNEDSYVDQVEGFDREKLDQDQTENEKEGYNKKRGPVKFFQRISSEVGKLVRNLDDAMFSSIEKQELFEALEDMKVKEERLLWQNEIMRNKLKELNVDVTELLSERDNNKNDSADEAKTQEMNEKTNPVASEDNNFGADGSHVDTQKELIKVHSNEINEEEPIELAKEEPHEGVKDITSEVKENEKELLRKDESRTSLGEDEWTSWE